MKCPQENDVLKDAQAGLFHLDTPLDCKAGAGADATRAQTNESPQKLAVSALRGATSGASALDLLRSGAWLTVERARAYSFILLAAFVLAIAGYIALSDGLNDFKGRPIATDFSNVYTAGLLVREGRASDPYDPVTHHAAEKKLFGSQTPFYGWHYPPFFLLVAAVLATLPYAWAVGAWLLATFAAYLAALGSIWPQRDTLLVASAFPAVIVNIGHGQNAFLTAALLGGALVLLNRRPLIAGILIGLLAYKPQFGILLPLVLVATGRWKAVFSACGTIAVLVLISWLALGGEVFKAFVQSTEFSRAVALESGAIGWEKIQSVFSAFRSFGSSIGVAYAAQVILLLVVAVSLTSLWRSAADYDLKAAALAIASLLATPYVLDYDLVVAAVGVGFCVRHGFSKGFLDYEASVLALVFAAPLVARVIMAATGVPVGLIAILALYVLIMRRAAIDLDAKRDLTRMRDRSPDAIEGGATIPATSVFQKK